MVAIVDAGGEGRRGSRDEAEGAVPAVRTWYGQLGYGVAWYGVLCGARSRPDRRSTEDLYQAHTLPVAELAYRR